MVLTRPLLARSTAVVPPAVVRYDEHEVVPAVAGEPVAAALFAHGIVATSRSLKYRRPRGPYCLTGDCGTCLARIDGVPNVRTCLTAVRDGMRVESQNRVGPPGLDPTAMADKVFGPAMDHHHFFLRPRMINQAMQTVARELAGLGQLPDAVAPSAAPPREHHPDVLVIGHGVAGRAAAQVLASAGHEVLAVERGLEREDTPGYRLLANTGVFAAYDDPACWAAHEVLADGPGRLHVIQPRHALVATGARDVMLPLPNNDLPGVVAARGLLRLLAQTGMAPAVPRVVIGEGPLAQACAEALHTEVIPARHVAELHGRGRVHGVRRTKDAGRDAEAELVALAGMPAPAFELARQAGAAVRYDGTGFAVLRDDTGVCSHTRRGPVWVAGDVTGYMGPLAASDDGRRVAEQIVAALARTPR